MEAGTGHHASEERDCEGDRHPDFKGGSGAENWECDIKNPVGKEIVMLSWNGNQHFEGFIF